MATTEAPAQIEAPVQIKAHSTIIKRLGRWTTARRYQVRAHRTGGFPTVDDPTRTV
jgi:hypothetical protein